jgi:hypothetical protein
MVYYFFHALQGCKRGVSYVFDRDLTREESDDEEEYVGSNSSEGGGNLSQSYCNDASSQVISDEQQQEEEDRDEEEGNAPGAGVGLNFEEHKKSFYCKYSAIYEKVKSTSHLIDDLKYSWILGILRAPPSKKDTMHIRKTRQIYSLGGNVENYCITRDGKTVTTYERVFEVLMMAHQKLGHARDIKKNKDAINDDLRYYGVPRSAVKCFVDTCPLVSLL